MKIEMRDGQPVIDAKYLAQLLELPVAQVQSKMRAEEITTVFETGEGEDAGKMRLTFFHGPKTVRLICDPDGTVLQTLRTDSGHG